MSIVPQRLKTRVLGLHVYPFLANNFQKSVNGDVKIYDEGKVRISFFWLQGLLEGEYIDTDSPDWDLPLFDSM